MAVYRGRSTRTLGDAMQWPHRWHLPYTKWGVALLSATCGGVASTLPGLSRPQRIGAFLLPAYCLVVGYFFGLVLVRLLGLVRRFRVPAALLVFYASLAMLILSMVLLPFAPFIEIWPDRGVQAYNVAAQVPSAIATMAAALHMYRRWQGVT
jgi:hypothetical protein